MPPSQFPVLPSTLPNNTPYFLKSKVPQTVNCPKCPNSIDCKKFETPFTVDYVDDLLHNLANINKWEGQQNTVYRQGMVMGKLYCGLDHCGISSDPRS